MGDLTAYEIARAAELPLNDAAYSLWKRQYYLDQDEVPTQAENQVTNLNDPEKFGRVVRDAIAEVIVDRTNAHNGPTFHRLKASHPGAADQDLQKAIKAAVRFETDCTRLFSSSEGSLYKDASQAVEKARLKNPDFTEVTYERAISDLCQAMR